MAESITVIDGLNYAAADGPSKRHPHPKSQAGSHGSRQWLVPLFICPGRNQPPHSRPGPPTAAITPPATATTR